MSKKIFFSPEEYRVSKNNNSYAGLAKILFTEQCRSWSFLNNNTNNLSKSINKKYLINNYEIEIKHIPHRIKSTTAKVDPVSIENRTCFLCGESLPEEQRGIKLLDKYVLLCNPYPIFKEHFTVPSLNHTPQEIVSRINDMVSLATGFNDEYLLFYNGPRCGASAPDHFHFQMCRQDDLPIVAYSKAYANEYSMINKHGSSEVLVSPDNFPTPHILLKSSNEKSLEQLWNNIYIKISIAYGENEEPLLNVMTFSRDSILHIIIFVRKKHRPHCYFEEGEKAILISPAAIDLSGIIIVPRREDYGKINEEVILNIYNEVLIDSESLKNIAVSKAF